MSIATLCLYIATWTLVAITPGPAVLCVLSYASRSGVRGSLPCIAGLQLGSLLFFVAVGTGLAALLATMTTAFSVLRLAGAVYLVWLGTKTFVASFRNRAAASAAKARSPHSGRRAFGQGLLIQVTNPKALLFASALLPQFLDPRQPVFGQLALLFALTFAIDVASMLTYASLVHGTLRFRQSGAAVWLERVFGLALIGFGARLALARK